MDTRRLGATGPNVGVIGLGCMGMSDYYGPTDEAESIATIREVLDSGVTLLDTGDSYGMGDNEALIRRALAGCPRDKFQISVKSGAQREPGGSYAGCDARPYAVKTALACTLRRLGTDYVDIYRPARLDPNVAIEETVGAIADMVQAGYVRHVGLSEVGATTLRHGPAVHPICDLQIEYSLVSRGPVASILPTCRELGVGITAYGVLSRGLISGHWDEARALTQDDFRAHAPRIADDNLQRNLDLVEAVRAVADGRGATVAELAIAWVAAQDPLVVPLVGARTRARLAESLGALTVHPDQETTRRLDAAIPAGAVAGARYADCAMAHLDSEQDEHPA